MEFTIRAMQAEDIKQVQDVAKSSWHATYEGIIPETIQQNFLKLAYSDERLQQRMEQSHILIAECDGSVVGFANFSPVNASKEAELGAIYLYPQYQGKGIGSALLQKGIADLDGVKHLYINVERDNQIGRHFYDAKGFQVVKEFDDDFDGHILKTVRMRRSV